MRSSARSVLARAVPAAAFLLAVTACADSSSASPSPASAAGRQQTATAEAPPTPSDRDTSMNIRLTIDGHRVDATLNDSPAARDLAGLLPLTLELEDFHGTERVGYPPRKLDTSGAPAPAAPKAGDLAYYAPWGNLALFYRDGPSASGDLLVLGRLDDSGDIGRLATADRVRIEAAA
ncbi:cyclophilin-like fold protein [Streptomyces kurssanovii]|uniref:Cyclophilin-like fold protein n=1 Tax=Streptomyces kurssanovii TaxID=67312 RepID=A0ABV3HPX0_9ACTN